MRLDIGTPVRYPDGEQTGTIHKVVFDPAAGTVHEIVIESPDLVGRLVLVPVALLRDDPGGVLTLDADRDAFAELPDYEVERYMDPPEGWTIPENYTPGDGLFPATMHYPLVPVFEESNAPEGTVEWSQGTEVLCTDGTFGVVDEVLIDETSGQLTGLVARSDADPSVRLLVPLGMIGEVDAQVVQLEMTLAELHDQATPYEEIAAEPETDSLAPSS